jgi:hypothetical protein
MDERQNKVPEKQVHKTQNTVKSVFRWLFVGLFAFLLISALIFQAPWKVLALLVVFLLACTALPKPFRKWFWLSVGVVVVVLIVWVFLPEDNEGWQPYTFDEEVAAFKAKYAIPDEENAATIYNELLENYDQDAFYANLPNDEWVKLPMREPWLSEEEPQIAEWLQQHQTTTAILLRASKIDKCQFPISPDTKPDTSSEMMRRLRQIRELANLSTSAANNDIAENRIDQALEKYVALLQMGKHISHQQSLIHTLVAISIEAIAIEQINRFIVTEDATAEHLRIIEEALAKIKHGWSDDFSRILEHEKLFCKNWVGRFYQIHPGSNKIRLSRDPLADLRTAWEENVKDQQQIEQRRQLLRVYIYPNYWEKKIIRAHTLLRWLFLPSNPEKVGKIIDTIFEKYYAMAKPDFDWKKQPQKPLGPPFPSESVWPCFNQRQAVERLAAYASGGTYHKLHDMYLRLVANQKGCQILITLRRYKNSNSNGNWPESLDDIKVMTASETLVDPINDGPFVYKLTEDSFTLYSKGKNNIDEGGKANRESGADDWPIWPSRYYRTKKENADAE